MSHACFLPILLLSLELEQDVSSQGSWEELALLVELERRWNARVAGVLGNQPLRQLMVRTKAGAGINTKDLSVSVLQWLIPAPHQQELYLAGGLVCACWVRIARPEEHSVLVQLVWVAGAWRAWQKGSGTLIPTEGLSECCALTRCLSSSPASCSLCLYLRSPTWAGPNARTNLTVKPKGTIGPSSFLQSHFALWAENSPDQWL